MSDRDSKKTRLSDIHQNNCGDVESGVCSQEKDFTSSLIEITDVSPLCFEYHGWSEEGINLCVDLNSSPSYWANKYRNEVCVSENVCMMNECRSLLQDLGCLGGSSSQGKGINEKQSTALGLVRYAAPNNYLSGAESCAEDVSEKTLKAINTPFIKFICGSETLKHHDSNPGDEIFEDGGLPDLVDPKNDLVVEQGNSREIDLDTDVKNIPSFAEEEVWCYAISGLLNM
ncbi:hypothetical protein DEO72_LG10g341 [Vigna unguiculata]|uniref:Uncharacterized protein n=1 Tax=Vigna unguiculata TaxID=3917 RepID=A0A4D6N891_VIGUN|nr:hypothetical protein DEO72_LG10g341 [Vigna unguiculata]